MKKKFLAFTVIAFSIYSLVLLLTVISRYRLEYNSEGVYFDEINLVRYNKDDVLTFVISFCFSLFVTMFQYWQYKKCN